MGSKNVCLTVNSDEIYGFLGPNGAGKPPAIRILPGFLRASTGSASGFDLDCWKDGPKIRENTGDVSGDVRLYSWLTLDRAVGILSQIH